MQAIRQTTDDLSADLSDNLAVSINVRKEQDSALRGAVQLAQSVQLLTYTVDEATRNFERTLAEAIERLPFTIAHGVVSLGHRTMASWFPDVGWLSITGIVKWLARLAWDNPVEVMVVYLLAYRCVPGVIALVWWFVVPLLGPAHLLLRFVRCLRPWLTTQSCDKASPHTTPLTPISSIGKAPSSLPSFKAGRLSPPFELPSFTPSHHNLLLLPSTPTHPKWTPPELPHIQSGKLL
ncbi:hypothetical protein PENSPDRAFT_384305 [Peniophora sp. CONT]|nr:hypothetical protein PENSPDRAFT_384305 [Peniophora sp. CONT]